MSAPDEFPWKTQSEVRFIPVQLDGVLIGYLWAAVTDDAAGFVARGAAGRAAHVADLEWTRRLRRAKANRLTPLQAVRYWVGAEEDPKAGAVAGTEEGAPSVEALEARAS
ncbi:MULTISPECIES: hypothetical protein [Streptomyces]|uniref:hypothetical protein n=1 Tax=Streptomyces TaxID=1883 RepID=UPI0013C42095|nr:MULTISPECIES: hypothetical protein [Streptomyces]MDX3068266.1 hypothetical protein [Streptomyces sp. ND04-05B]MDX3519703.1 hypothetical protein [Streptomyces scabiei]